MQIANWFTTDDEQVRMRWITYLVNVLFTFQVVIPLYINSNFLTSFVSEQITSFTYTAAALLTIATIAATSRAIRVLGNYQTTLTLLLIDVGALLVLAYSEAVAVLLLAFIAHWILASAIRYHLDIFLESFSDDDTTGQTRGTLSALRHIPFILGPLLAGLVIGDSNFAAMYLTAAVFSLPAIYILIRYFRDFSDPEYRYHTLWDSLKTAWNDVNIRWALACMFILRLFFAWMVVYTPIYLHREVGLAFDEIGIIFSIMLLPFVLFGRGLGEIADRWLGEKELLIAGFFVAAGFTASLTFVDTTDVIVWGLLLFGTRVGATMIQVMTSGYFFKHIDADETNELSLLRMIKPAAYVLAPALATLMLALFPFSYIFIGIAGVLLLGAAAAAPIVDTR